jgi:hypothetical protein
MTRQGDQACCCPSRGKPSDVGDVLEVTVPRNEGSRLRGDGDDQLTHSHTSLK